MFQPRDRDLCLAKIGRYSPLEAATLAGALLLVPQNLHFLASLETLAHCCHAGLAGGKRAATRNNARELFQGLRAWVGFADDFPNFPGTQAFTFRGGNYVLIGPDPGSAFALRLLAEIGANNSTTPANTVVSKFVHFCCRISNRIAERAELRRNQAVPDQRQNFVPPERALRALQEAVCFSEVEWNTILQRCGLRYADVGPLIATPRPSNLGEMPWASDALEHRPFLVCGREIVAFAPHRIVEAFVNHIRALISEDEASREVLRGQFHSLFLSVLDADAKRLGWRKLLPWSPCKSNVPMAEAVFEWDDNRLVHLLASSDGLSSDPLSPAADQEDVRQKFALLLAGSPIVESFCVHIYAPMSQMLIAGVGEDPSGELLTLPAWDFEAMASGFKDVDTRAFVGRYLRARSALRTRGVLGTANELDAMAAWRDFNYRFPLVEAIEVLPGHAKSVRDRALAARDRHAALSWNANSFVEVEVCEDPSTPIFALVYPDERFARVVVELPGRFVWFEADRHELRKDVFVRAISERSRLPLSSTEALLEAFSLWPRTEFLKPPAPFRPSDVFPWHVNRRLSVLQRPFVRSIDDNVLFGCALAQRSAAYILHLMRLGRFKARTKGLKDAMAACTKAAGKSFNAEVAEVLRGRALVVLENVTKFGKLRLRSEENQPLGDVDVLAIDLQRKLLFAIECKDVAPDRMPHEVQNSIETLFVGTASDLSAQEKHLRRTSWLRRNLAEVARHLDIAPADDWKVVPVLVTSRSLHSPLLGRAKMMVHTMDELQNGVALDPTPPTL